MDAIKRSRIVLGSLPPREEGAGSQARPKIVAKEGESCYQNCDCAFGLICREAVCVSDW
jgi:hypothetical protein